MEEDRVRRRIWVVAMFVGRGRSNGIRLDGRATAGHRKTARPLDKGLCSPYVGLQEVASDGTRA